MKDDGMGGIGRYDAASVKYGDYDPDSPAVFEELKRVIQATLPQAPIEHVGSSAVAGMWGKNIIDIAVSVKDVELQRTVSRMIGLGFQLSGFSSIHSPVLLGSFFFKGKTYGVHVYLRERDSRVYKIWLFFRDYLKKHPEEARKYEGMKKEAAKDEEKYEAAKVHFIKSVIHKARKEEKEKTPELEKQPVY